MIFFRHKIQQSFDDDFFVTVYLQRNSIFLRWRNKEVFEMNQFHRAKCLKNISNR